MERAVLFSWRKQADRSLVFLLWSLQCCLTHKKGDNDQHLITTGDNNEEDVDITVYKSACVCS